MYIQRLACNVMYVIRAAWSSISWYLPCEQNAIRWCPVPDRDESWLLLKRTSEKASLFLLFFKYVNAASQACGSGTSKKFWQPRRLEDAATPLTIKYVNVDCEFGITRTKKTLRYSRFSNSRHHLMILNSSWRRHDSLRLSNLCCVFIVTVSSIC